MSQAFGYRNAVNTVIIYVGMRAGLYGVNYTFLKTYSNSRLRCRGALDFHCLVKIQNYCLYNMRQALAAPLIAMFYIFSIVGLFQTVEKQIFLMYLFLVYFPYMPISGE